MTSVPPPPLAAVRLASRNSAQRRKMKLPAGLPKGFPARVFVEEDRPDSDLVAEECRKRGIPVVTYSYEDMLQRRIVRNRKEDLVVGDTAEVAQALRRIGVVPQEPPDYPACLRPYLQRKVWRSTLGAVHERLKTDPTKIFVKPAGEAKIFNGEVVGGDTIEMVSNFWLGPKPSQGGFGMGLPRSTPVWCSEVLKMLHEYRVYVVNGKIRAVAHYVSKGPLVERYSHLDMGVVREAVATFCASDEGRDIVGFGADFAVMRNQQGQLVTGLIEVNDGWMCGHYEGCSARDYTNMMLVRYGRLVQPLYDQGAK